MTPPMASGPEFRTLADLMKRLGGVPLDRVQYHPPPGTATLADVIEHERRTDRVCELVDGVLVEKAMGYRESLLAIFLAEVLNGFVRSANLGVVTGADGTVELIPDLVRIPDVAFTSWNRMPGRRVPTEPIPRLVPDLAIEVLSRGNTPGEMARKRQDYFDAGVALLWEVDPVARTVTVYTTPTASTTLNVGDTLDGGTALPGFTLPLAALFAELDRQG
jgi:Uma2 family endonuclease